MFFLSISVGVGWVGRADVGVVNVVLQIIVCLFSTSLIFTRKIFQGPGLSGSSSSMHRRAPNLGKYVMILKRGEKWWALRSAVLQFGGSVQFRASCKDVSHDLRWLV